MDGLIAAAPTCPDDPPVAGHSRRDGTHGLRPPTRAFLPAAPRGPSLRRNISWTLIGNVIYAACQWGMLVAIIRLGTPEMAGRFVLALGIVTPVFMLANLQMRQLHVTDAGAVFRRRDYVVVRVFTTGIALAVVVGIGIALELTSLLLSVGAARAIQSFSELLHGFQQRRERMALISISMMAMGVLSVAFVGVAIWMTESLEAGMVGWMIAGLLVLLVIDVPVGVGGQGWDTAYRALQTIVGTCFTPKYWRSTIIPLLRQGMTLGAASFLLSLNAQIPRYAIATFLNEHQLGIYSALAYFTVVGNVVIMALGQSVSPRLALYHADRDMRRFRGLVLKSLSIIWAFLAAALLVTLCFGESLIRLCYGSEYASYDWLLTALVATSSVTFTTSILGFAATACRSFISQPIVVVPGLLVALCVCWALVPRYGLYGALAGHAASWMVLCAGYVLILARLGLRLEIR